MNRYNRILTFLLILFAYKTFGQQPIKSLTSSEIALALKKINVVGSVLYVAAHPDDENTRLLAYLANEKLLKTAYLSLTRGDGGQNLVGPEIREQLGIIRTQELLAARSIDGAEQYFSRANDFGFSKTPEETLKIWDKDKVLSDVVWIIRKQRPDVIITRFPKTGEGGHGHHTASAILAEEAFNAAADPAKFPEQLKWVKPWQAKRIYWNSFRSEVGLKVDVGAYNPLLGRAYTEIAADSRSMHKSQGFGSAKQRGERFEYLSYIAGEKAQNSVFEDIDFSWKRVKNSDQFSKLITEALDKYNTSNPAASIPLLMKAYGALKNVADPYWAEEKKADLIKVILACAGFYYETTAADFQTYPGGEVNVSIELVNRSPQIIKLKSIKFPGDKKDSLTSKDLAYNELITVKRNITIPLDAQYSQIYWLKEPYNEGIFTVKDQALIGSPQNIAPLSGAITLEIENETIRLESPVLYKWTDPVDGEKYRTVEIIPEVTAKINEGVFLFPNTTSKNIEVTLTSQKNNATGALSLDVPKGWKVEPASVSFELKEKNEEKTFTFKVAPPQEAENAKVVVKIKIGEKIISRSKVTIQHNHIPAQTFLPEASARLVRLDLNISGKTIGYIEGAGDDIPSLLKQAGFVVLTVSDQQLNDPNELAKFDAIVVGVRGYNTNDKLKGAQSSLMTYVNQGGNLVVQYNNNFRLVTEELGPYPIKLSRDRVTVQESPIKVLNEKHPLLNYPNKITDKDFQGWVQERGLYFPSDWDKNYETIISAEDPGEKSLQGGILVAKPGKGSYIYTSYSWFRQLPEGVPGAIRLFTNLVSYTREIKAETLKRGK